MNKLLASLLKAAGRQPDSVPVRRVRAEEAKRMMDSGPVTVVDVRRADEFADGHILGALNLPNETIEQTAAALPDQSAVILIYCRSGRRSAQAAARLAHQGYTHIVDFGGILNWPYEITAPENPR